mgnify:CR=1 FL=1
MAEQTGRDVLNRLIQTCRDGELGFRYAANHVRYPDVNTLFLELANQRDAFAGEILPHAQRLGGAGQQRRRRLASSLDNYQGHGRCSRERGHYSRGRARRANRAGGIEDALDGMLPPTARDLVDRHHSHIRQSFNRVHAMLTL